MKGRGFRTGGGAIFGGHCPVSMVVVLEEAVLAMVRWELESGFENHKLIEGWLDESRSTSVAYGGPKVLWMVFLHRPNLNSAVTEARCWRDGNARLAGVSRKHWISWREASGWWILVPGVVPTE